MQREKYEKNEREKKIMWKIEEREKKDKIQRKK